MHFFFVLSYSKKILFSKRLKFELKFYIINLRLISFSNNHQKPEPRNFGSVSKKECALKLSTENKNDCLL